MPPKENNSMMICLINKKSRFRMKIIKRFLLMFSKKRICLMIKGSKETCKGIISLLIERLIRKTIEISIEGKTMIDIEMRGGGITIRMIEKRINTMI